MEPTLRQIRSFVALARIANFTRAARELHVSQPALTVQIRQMEDAIGAPLFDRNTRSVSLTRVGRELAAQLERVQDELDNILGEAREVASRRVGVVHMACIPSFAGSVLPDAIAAFRKEHPNIAFSLKDANWSRVVAMVRAGEVDFAVGDMAVPEPDLEFIPMMRDRMQVIFSKEHPIGKLRKVTLAALSEHSMVMMNSDTSARRTIDEAFSRAACYPQRACEVLYTTSAVAMVRAGLGFTILPASAIEWRAHPGLAVRFIDDPAFVRKIGIIKQPRRTLPPASRAFAQRLLGEKGARKLE